jgi:hypothetical protein
MTDGRPESIGINRDAKCVCGHHPLEHDQTNHIMTGGPAPCEECDCSDLRLAAGSPCWLELFDKDGARIQ